MKVFITWSGERAKKIAEAFRQWLPSVIQSVDPWMSEADIRAGARWQAELNGQLEQTDYGIVVLTPESLSAPWIHYEAGALAKKVDTGAVCPYLVDISERTTVVGPLAQFHSKLANEKETFDLIKAINQRVERKLDDALLKDTFTKLFWPRLEKAINDSLSAAPTEQRASRSPNDLLEEILEKVRSLDRQLAIALDSARRGRIEDFGFSQEELNEALAALKTLPVPKLLPEPSKSKKGQQNDDS
jgi:hypothetical protein